MIRGPQTPATPQPTRGTGRMKTMTTRTSFSSTVALLATLALAGMVRAESPGVIGQLTVEPPRLVMTHLRRARSLIVTAQTPLGRTVDLTAGATFRSSNPAVVRVSPLGWVEPVSNGTAKIQVQANG